MENEVKVKICGITNLADALCAQESGADFLGFVFAQSPRSVHPKDAKHIIKNLSDSVKIAAVFVNENREVVDKIINTLGRVDLLQFHGDETPEYCRQFSDKKKIKAFRVKDERSLSGIKDFKDIDFILLDAYCEKNYGGTGKGFDPGLALKAKLFNMPLFLSGGLNPGNVKDALIKVNPFCLDVSSGVEASPGKKDHALIKQFIENAKKRS